MKGFPNSGRLLFQVELKPIQGNRFQPTGFPDLGAAEILLHSGSRSLLVESAQSMAKRMQLLCLNEKRDDFVEPLKGLSVIKDEKNSTNSVLESHKAASYYIIQDNSIKKKLENIDNDIKLGTYSDAAKLLFEMDVNSLLHGIWASHIGGGKIKIPRVLSAFIEADNIGDAISGGVKIDHVNPKKDDSSGAEFGQGHIPFSRTEYTAETITAYFNVDLDQIQSYQLDKEKNNLLVTLALWKIRTFLETNLRLRTACDLQIVGQVQAVGSSKYDLPDKLTLDSEIKKLIKKCSSSLKQTTIKR